MNAIRESLRDIECLSSSKLDEAVEPYKEDGLDIGTSKALQQVLDAELDDPLETKYKKLLALSTLIAQHKEVLPEDVKYENSTELATVIDDSVTRTKVAYQIASQGLDLDVAADYLMDKAAARVSGAVDVAFESGVAGEMMTDGIIVASNAIPYVGPAISATLQSCRPMVREVVRMVEEPVRKMIHNGIKSISDAAKTIVHETIETVTTTVEILARTAVRSLFG